MTGAEVTPRAWQTPTEIKMCYGLVLAFQRPYQITSVKL